MPQMRTCLIVRHAIAEERDDFARTGRPDGERPLTGAGRRRMEAAARGLTRILPGLERVATSPWTRARQTAEIVAAAYGAPPMTTTPLLLPDAAPQDLLAWVFSEAHPGLTALVGHEPHLSEWIGWAVTGAATSIVDLKKGAACLLAFPGPPAPGGAVVQWLAPPRLLRRLGAKA